MENLIDRFHSLLNHPAGFFSLMEQDLKKHLKNSRLHPAPHEYFEILNDISQFTAQDKARRL